MRRRLVGWSVANDFVKMRCDCALSFSRVLKASRNPCPTLDLTIDVSLNARRRIIDRSVLLKSKNLVKSPRLLLKSSYRSFPLTAAREDFAC